MCGCRLPLSDTWATGQESPKGTDEVTVPPENEIPGGSEQAAALKGAQFFSPDGRYYRTPTSLYTCYQQKYLLAVVTY